MPRPKAERPLPTGARRNPDSGRITLMFAVDDAGKRRRLSQYKVLPSEPRSYATVDEAWDGFNRVNAYIAQEIDRAATVGGWAERWTDEDDKQWGAHGTECPRRSRHAIFTYASHTRSFVEAHRDREVASIGEADIRAWTQHDGYIPSGMTALGTMFKDATTAGLRSGANPVVEFAKKAEQYLRVMREDKEADPPSAEQVDALLRRLYSGDYPRSLYGWFLTGTTTGMRGSEIDGMQFKYVDFEKGTYSIQVQLHPRTGVLDRPKHNSRRLVALSPLVLEEIRGQMGMADTPDGDGFIWLNTFSAPWRHSSRDKWWTKTSDGITLQSLVGDATMYNATRHYWASWAVNVAGLTPYQAAILYGHKDGGKLITKVYAKPDQAAAVEAARAAAAAQPVRLDDYRRRRSA